MKPMGVGARWLRFVIFCGLAWLFMFAIPKGFFINYYIPMSFFLLMFSAIYGGIGLGWPWAAPMGSWKPGTNRLIPGISMTILWIVTALVFAWIEQYLWPAHPMWPFGAFLGVTIFGTTLWYAFDMIAPTTSAFKKPIANIIFATCVILGISALAWASYTNTGVEGVPWNMGGAIDAGGYWFPLVIWIIVFIELWGAPMGFQGWPFYKLGKPLAPILITVFSCFLGWLFWEWTLASGMNPSFSSAGIAAGIIIWFFFQALGFHLWPGTKVKQPLRGVINLLFVCVMTAVWLALCQVILVPIQGQLAAAGVELDIHTVTAFYSLHICSLFFLVHEFFFMRAPWAPGGPPLGPEEIA